MKNMNLLKNITNHKNFLYLISILNILTLFSYGITFIFATIFSILSSFHTEDPYLNEISKKIMITNIMSSALFITGILAYFSILYFNLIAFYFPLLILSIICFLIGIIILYFHSVKSLLKIINS